MNALLRKTIVVKMMALLFGCISSQEENTFEKATRSKGYEDNIKVGPAHDSIIRRLEHTELRDLLSSRTLKGVTPSGRDWIVNFRLPDQADINWSNRFEVDQDDGIWRIEGDYVCIKWKKLYNSEEKCMNIYFVSQGQYNIFYDNGQLYSHMTLN